MNKNRLPTWTFIFALLTFCLGTQRAWTEEPISPPPSSADARGPFDTNALPSVLKPWVPWVLDSFAEYGCQQIDGSFVCTWPATLELRLTEEGGTFSQMVTIDHRGRFLLPGSLVQWPLNVRANNVPIPVLNANGAPTVMLEAGVIRIEGEFKWPKLPEGLNVPPDYALIALSINNALVPMVQRDSDGRLWLKKSTRPEETENKFTLEVYRKITDGVPMMVTTNLVVRSSGTPNEVTLPNVLLKETLPISVTAGLPVRLDADGALKLQTRGGTHEVEIVAVVTKNLESFQAITRPEPWPENEIWVFEPNDKIRQTEIRGAPGIDPKRTNLKPDWQQLAAYQVAPKDTLTIRTTRRGEANPPPDQITLHRKIWLDMDGGGFTVEDAITGTLHRTSRLDMIHGRLGHVRVSGQDQVITTNPKSSQAGVELRENNVDLHAESKINGGISSLRAIGWNTDVQELQTALYLPPGWDLLTASGVDSIPGTWWDSWSLFGFFFVLLASIAVGKLTKWYFGILALLTLVLLHNEADVEVLVAIGLPLLITLGLLKALPKGKFRLGVTIAWSVFALVMAASAIPFSVQQIRQGLYPQLEDEYYTPPRQYDEYPLAVSKSEENDMERPQEQQEALKDLGYMEGEVQEQKADDSIKRQARKKISSAEAGLRAPLSSNAPGGNYKFKQKAALQQDPQAVVQTGPGIPTWQWNQFFLTWQGPVSKDQQIRLYLIGPTLKLILSIVRILLLTLLAMMLIMEAFRAIKQPPAPPTAPKRNKSKEAAVATGALFLFATTTASAQLPSSGQLYELGEKITRPAACTPHCMDTASLTLNVQNGIATMSATVHAGAPVAWPVPGPVAKWIPKEVIVNGKNETALRLQPNGFIYVKLNQGIHTITLRGPMNNESAFTLEFIDIPHRGTVTAPDYTVDGLREDGRFETSIALTRHIREETSLHSDINTGSDTGYNPWLKVERTLDLGIPWLVHTTVSRVSPAGAPLMLRIPLLKGEHVTESNLEVKDDAVMVALGREEMTVSWSSMLKEANTLLLMAPKGENWTEQWTVQCSPIWQCAPLGIPPIENGVDTKIYRPWPGEKLTIHTHRPKAMAGQTVTIDGVRIQVSPGLRLTETVMTVDIRSSQGGVQQMTLPHGISIQQFSVNGEKRPFKQKKNVLEVALRPGKQKIMVTWQQQGGITNAFRAPQVKFGANASSTNASNVHLTVDMPVDRWLLGVSGPSWGPAVLFWGYLLTILIVSFFILGRAKFSPLKGWQWALLTFGLTQVPIAVAIIIVGWFFLLSWRSGNPANSAQWVWKNLLQVGIAIWTLIALFCLLGAVYNGLAVQPDMQVAGLDSDNGTLNWYMDRIDMITPSATVWSVPLLVWKSIMLAWSLWLAYSLIRWSRWAFKSYTEGGFWHAPPARKVVTSQTAASQTAATVPKPEDTLPPDKTS